MAINRDVLRLRQPFLALHNQMERLGEEEMGSLTYAEASLFHGATDLINRLLESIYNRAVEEVSDV